MIGPRPASWASTPATGNLGELGLDTRHPQPAFGDVFTRPRPAAVLTAPLGPRTGRFVTLALPLAPTTVPKSPDRALPAAPRAVLTLGPNSYFKTLKRAVLGCSDKNLPNAKTLKDIEDPNDREHAIQAERQHLYVAMTRARERLHLSWSGTPSPFLNTFTTNSKGAQNL